jgi:hypothetical protein
MSRMWVVFIIASSNVVSQSAKVKDFETEQIVKNH